MLSQESALFCEEYQKTGDRDSALCLAFGDFVPDGDDLASKANRARQLRALLADPDVQEYLAFLAQEGFTRGAIPLRDHIFDLGVRGSVIDDDIELVRRMTATTPQAVSALSSLHAQRIRIEELKGKASALYGERREVNLKASGLPTSFSVDWAA